MAFNLNKILQNINDMTREKIIEAVPYLQKIQGIEKMSIFEIKEILNNRQKEMIDFNIELDESKKKKDETIENLTADFKINIKKCDINKDGERIKKEYYDNLDKISKEYDNKLDEIEKKYFSE